MGKSIDTLIPDIYEALGEADVFSPNTPTLFGEESKELFYNEFMNKKNPLSRGGLRLSNYGMKCERKLWNTVNNPPNKDRLPGPDKFRFFYGDLLEMVVLFLAKQTGHTVEYEQAEVSLLGVKGHMDAIIDGWVVDVKTAAAHYFDKYAKGNQLRLDDPFGYLPQITAYLAAAGKKDYCTEKNKAAFLFINKQNGQMYLDKYDLTKEVSKCADVMSEKMELVAGVEPVGRLPAVPYSKTGDNMRLSTDCKFCFNKHNCWPELRTFQYSNGPVDLVVVAKEPRVPEVKEDGSHYI